MEEILPLPENVAGCLMEDILHFQYNNPMDLDDQDTIDHHSGALDPQPLDFRFEWDNNVFTNMALDRSGIQCSLQGDDAPVPHPSLEPSNPCDTTIDTDMETMSTEPTVISEARSIIIEKGQQRCPLCVVSLKGGAKEVRKHIFKKHPGHKVESGCSGRPKTQRPTTQAGSSRKRRRLTDHPDQAARTLSSTRNGSSESMYVSMKQWRELQKELLFQRQQYADLQVRVFVQAQAHENVVRVLRQFDNTPGRYRIMAMMHNLHEAGWELDLVLRWIGHPRVQYLAIWVLHQFYETLRIHEPSVEVRMYLRPNFPASEYVLFHSPESLHSKAYLSRRNAREISTFKMQRKDSAFIEVFCKALSEKFCETSLDTQVMKGVVIHAPDTSPNQLALFRFEEGQYDPYLI